MKVLVEAAGMARWLSSTGTSFKDVNEIEKLLADVNLHPINISSTEFTTVNKKENEHWQRIKKVGPR